MVVRWKGFAFTRPRIIQVGAIVVLVLLGLVLPYLTLDYLKDLPRLAVPTLYVVGAEDTGAPPSVMRDMAHATPGARLEVIPGAAHLPNIDAMTQFDAVIAPFLELKIA